MSKTDKTANSGMGRKQWQSQLMVVGILVVICIICHFITGGKLLQLSNIKTIMTQWTYPLLVGLGMMFIFSTGMIDLSVGAQIILAANVGAILVEDYHLGYPGLILGTLAALVICELISMSCAVFLNIPSWVAGLGMALVYEAIASFYLNLRAQKSGAGTVYLESCRALGTFPWIVIVALCVFLVAYVVYSRSKLGIQVQAVGDSPEVAESMGINHRKTIILAAILGAVIIGIGAVTQESYTGRFTSTSGLGSLGGIFKSLAGVLIAGSFSRIFSQPVGLLVGSFIVTALFNILTLVGVPSGTGQEMCLGAVVILCGILASYKTKGVVK